MSMQRKTSKTRWVLCVRNRGYPASLERGKVYRSLSDSMGARHDLTRVVDESGESYLYPAEFFKPIQLTPALQRALREGARKSKR